MHTGFEYVKNEENKRFEGTSINFNKKPGTSPLIFLTNVLYITPQDVLMTLEILGKIQNTIGQEMYGAFYLHIIVRFSVNYMRMPQTIFTFLFQS